MTPITATLIKSNSVPSTSFPDFAPSCKPSDTHTIHIPFIPPFPSGLPVRIILTPNNVGLEPGDHNAAPVGVAQHVIDTGFDLHARNSDCVAGKAGFNWIAFKEAPGITPPPPVPALHMRVLQPLRLTGVGGNNDEYLAPDCKPDDSVVQKVTFWSPMPTEPVVVVLTASNAHIKPFIPFSTPGNATLLYHNAAVVGIVQDSKANGFTLFARSSDCGYGNSAFYYLADAFAPNQGDRSLWVDTGELQATEWPLSGGSVDFAPNCKDDDTKSVSIDFHRPFLTPPVVLLTANDLGIADHNAALVGIAQDVTPWGFTLTARNSDCSAGQAGFFWVAVGCGLGCG